MHATEQLNWTQLARTSKKLSTLQQTQKYNWLYFYFEFYLMPSNSQQDNSTIQRIHYIKYKKRTKKINVLRRRKNLQRIYQHLTTLHGTNLPINFWQWKLSTVEKLNLYFYFYFCSHLDWMLIFSAVDILLSNIIYYINTHKWYNNNNNNDVITNRYGCNRRSTTVDFLADT